MIEFLRTLTPLSWFLTFVFMLIVAGGIGALGGFIHSRLKAKDKLKIERMKYEASIATTNRDLQLSKEREQAMALRALQIEHDLPVSYNSILDDPKPERKKQKEIR